ncbi:uncharacterized protein [Salvelinus alpinus]|uniref:uncharacterized protein n=1 Tax=Salvelinus alpinus TaxID=8036 RepID=UPI0039FBC9D9
MRRQVIEAGTRGSPNIFGAESGYRPEPTPRAYRGERVTGQAPCYAGKRTVSPVRMHSPVRSEPALRKHHARVGIQPGRIVPAQRSWSPVRRFGPGYPAPALRTVSPMRCDCSVRPMPTLRPCRAKVGIQPRGEVQVLSTRSPVLPHSPDQASSRSPQPGSSCASSKDQASSRSPQHGPSSASSKDQASSDGPQSGASSDVSNPEPPATVPSPGPATKVPSPGPATRVSAPEAPPKWWEPEAEGGLRPAPEPPPLAVMLLFLSASSNDMYVKIVSPWEFGMLRVESVFATVIVISQIFQLDLIWSL